MQLIGLYRLVHSFKVFACESPGFAWSSFMVVRSCIAQSVAIATNLPMTQSQARGRYDVWVSLCQSANYAQ